MDNIERKMYKVVLLGDNYIGTTCLIRRYIYNEYDPTKYSYSAKLFEKTIILENGKEVLCQFWDLYNQERYYSLNKLYIKKSHGIILTYDITKRSSFERMHYLLDMVKRDFEGIILFALVGLKIDSFMEEEVSEEEARKFAKDNNMPFYLTSAKENSGVYECFNGIINELSRKEEIENENKNIINLNNIRRERPSKKGCLK